MTAATVLRELFAVGCYDDEAMIPASVILRIANDMGIDLNPCFECHQYDSEHSDTCINDVCRFCQLRGRACVCDRDYETSVDK